VDFGAQSRLGVSLCFGLTEHPTQHIGAAERRATNVFRQDELMRLSELATSNRPYLASGYTPCVLA
jgi:hypothetical protein